MGHLIQHVEEGEKSLRDYASPRSEDFDMQKLDSVLRATEYEIKPQIIRWWWQTPLEEMRRTIHIDISSGSQCYATRYNKTEFR